MASAAKNSMYYGIGSIVRALTSFLLLPVYANILGASQYGILNLLQTFYAIVAPIMTLSVEKSIYRLYFDYKSDDEKKEFLSTVFWAINGTSIVVIAICMLLGGPIASYLGDVDVVTILYPVIIYTYFSALITYCQILLQTQQRGGLYLLVSMLMLVIYNVLALFFLFYWTPTYKAEVYASLINYALILPVAFLFIRKQITFHFNLAIFKVVLLYTMPLFMMSMFSWILSASDRLFIANYQNTYDVGLYSMAFKMASIALMFAGAIKQAFDPYFFNAVNSKDNDSVKKQIKPANDTMIFLTSLICLCVVLFGRLFVGIFLNEEYQACVLYLYFLVVSSLFTQQATVLNVMILQNKKTLLLSIITITGGVLSLLLNMILIPQFGSIIAAVDSMIVGIYMFVVTWYFAKKNYYIQINFGNIWVVLIIIALCSLIDFSINNIFYGVLSKIGISAICIFVFTKMKFMSYPIMGVVIRRSLNKMGVKKVK